MSRTLLSLAGFQVIISGRFWVIAEEGGYNIDRTFDSENDACRFFLKEALSDPICRKDFKAFPPTPEEFNAWRKKELDKYGLNDVDDPPIPA